jgi:hypothetical protein
LARRELLDVSPVAEADKPLLFVDVDGVITLFGYPEELGAPGPTHWIDGAPHCIRDGCGDRLARLAERFELVWATGWEERANRFLPEVLGPHVSELPSLSFGGRAVFGSADWKVEEIDRYARGRAAAWIDDNIDERCRAWAQSRSEPTNLVQTWPGTGLTEDHVRQLLWWADELGAAGEDRTRLRSAV